MQRTGVIAIDRSRILKAIKNELDRMYQWSDQFAKKCVNTEYSSNLVEHMHHAEALIELLEIADCGSFGGFDTGFSGLYSLEERYENLANKKVRTAV